MPRYFPPHHALIFKNGAALFFIAKACSASASAAGAVSRGCAAVVAEENEKQCNDNDPSQCVVVKNVAKTIHKNSLLSCRSYQ